MTTDERRFLPYGRQQVDDADVAAVVDVLRGDFLTTGPAVAQFEAALGGATGAAHMVACSSGTAALHLAALAAGLGPGMCAIVPAITFVATANAPRFTGAEIVFADVDPETGLMGPAEVEDAIARSSKPVRAIFPVDLNGQCADLAALRAIADRHGAWLIEDACHALGSLYRDSPVGDGHFADLTCFSFHPVKTITCGEGGAVATNDADLARRMEHLRNHSIERDADAFTQPDIALSESGQPAPWYYEVVEPGYNYRMSDLHAALGVSQLTKLKKFAAERRALVAAYHVALESLAPCVRPVKQAPDNDPCWHLMVALIDFAAAGTDRAAVCNALRAEGIGTQVHYVPVPFQPYYRRPGDDNAYPGAGDYYRQCLSLPLHVGLTPADVGFVASVLQRVLGL